MDRSSQPTFNFVNLSHPDELKDQETQSRIRRLAMTEVGKARRKPKTKRARNEIILEFRAAPRNMNLAALNRIGGGGEIDPFSSYPIELDEASRALVVNIFRQNTSHSTMLRGSWWLVGLYGAASFNTVLANSQLYIRLQMTGQAYITEDDAEGLAYYSKAVKIVNEKLNDPRQHTTYEMMAAIGSFMCHDWIIGASASWTRHRDALLKIIELRGGLDTITNEVLRVTLSWCDLCGAYPQDIPTSFPMPATWAANARSPPNSPRPHSNISLQWKQRFPMKQDWISIFDDIAQLISLDRALTDKQIEEATASGAWTEPTMVRLLCLRPLHAGFESENLIEEVCRLGTLLFLAPIWRLMGAHPARTFTFTRYLLWTLNNHAADWNELKPLLIWTIYFAALETRDEVERGQFTFMLATLMTGLHIGQWEEFMAIIKDVLWVEKIYASSGNTIRDEVMGLFDRSPSVETLSDEENEEPN